MNRIHYTIKGIQNSTMKTQIKNVLQDLEGVQMVNVDLGHGSVEVGYNEPATENQIKQCIEHVGCEIQ